MPVGVYQRTEEHRKKISLGHKGLSPSKEARKKMSLAKIGRKLSEEHKRNLVLNRKGMLGKHHSFETKMKLSKFFKGKFTGENHPRWQGGTVVSRKRYESQKRNGGKLSYKTIQLVYEDSIKRYGTLTCYLCLKPIEFGDDHLEHKIPLSRGGTNDYCNLGIAHSTCNFKKSNKTVEEFLN